MELADWGGSFTNHPEVKSISKCYYSHNNTTKLKFLLLKKRQEICIL